jgi:hypothetical protein
VDSFIPIIIILICIGIGKYLYYASIGAAKKTGIDFPYFKKPQFFTAAEKKFYDILIRAVDQEFVVFSKCRVADLIGVDSKKHFGAFNRIKSKHIDFVIVRKSDGGLICGIELDDSSHKRWDRVKRDLFLDEVFATVDLPLFRFKVQKVYSVSDIQKALVLDL